MATASAHTPTAEIVEEIYDCVARPSQWQGTLDRLRIGVGGRVALIGVIESSTRVTRLAVATGEAALARTLLDDHKDDVPFLLAAPRLAFDEAYTVDKVYGFLDPGTQERWRNAKVTQNFVIPNGLDDFLWLTLMKQTTRTGSLVILTGRDKQIKADDLQWMQTMAPHVRRAVTIGDLFDADRALAAVFRRLVEALAHAVLIVTADMRVLFANAAAEALLDERVVVALSGGRLTVPFTHAERAIARAVSLGERDEVALGACGINVPLASVETPAIAHVLPLARREAEARFSDSAVAAIFISVAGVTPSPAIEAIAALFGLTPAEKRVVTQVAEGKSRKDIALSQGVSDGTVKTQLSAIFDKTGTHDQRHLELLIREITPPVLPPSQR
ncbi:MAG: helix-turn-helix transcriptional regulator [Alphaproteobacteria bacterium]|nr:helix-turn-helix transcriptional regulator [Alphaproteobacteria bacterium]